jgi:hypothetical protein
MAVTDAPTVSSEEGRAGLELSDKAMTLLRRLVSQSIAYGTRWWTLERCPEDREAWDELYRAGLTRREMYSQKGITAEAVCVALGWQPTASPTS